MRNAGDGAVIAITGGFGALGRAVGKAALATGAKVVLIGRGTAPADGPAGAVLMGGVDVANAKAAKDAFAHVRDNLGRIDALLNIAGGFVWETLEAGEPQTWSRMFAVNLETTVTASRAVLPHLIESGGAIVNVGASSALKAGAGMGPYAASKAGVMKFTEALAEEMKGRVRVNAVLPSIIDTPANRADMPKADPSKWVRPSDLAAVMLFLASDAARAVTGALIPVTAQT